MSSNKVGTDLALTAVFAALIAAFSLVPAIALPGVAVPITFQTLAVCLCGLVLGPLRGMAAVGLWMLVGFAGVPVFSKGGSSLAVMAGPTAGYLVGFFVGAFAIGALARMIVHRVNNMAVRTALLAVVCFLASILIYYPLGAVGLMINMHAKSFGVAYAVNVAFLPLDAVKAALAAITATSVHKAFPFLLFGGQSTVVATHE